MNDIPPDAKPTPLEAMLRDRIRSEGSISVAGYMDACLNDPEHGYYRRQPAIGAGADFVTAPEISQTFGELIGLWCAVVWQQMGSPQPLNLVELGPGRGTLMRDALRATRIVPGFHDALKVHLIDRNDTLRALQQRTLADMGVPVAFHCDASEALTTPSHIGAGATLVIGNEFLDTLPVEQFEYAAGSWRDRTIAIDGNDRLCFKADMATSQALSVLPNALSPRAGDVFEVSPHHRVYADLVLKARATLGPLAALFIDYGHAATGFGDTVQGVAAHAHVSPFYAPGETDLSAHVDFQHFGEECRRAGLAVDGPVPQAEFLGRLGIVERASRLMAANPALAGTIEAQVQRLMAPNGMGSRFLALGVRSPELAPLPALA